MPESGPYSWSNRGFRWSVVALVALTIVSILAGFVWLPSAQADFTVEGLWASICRAAGVPASWSGPSEPKGARRSTGVVIDPAMMRAGSREDVGRGATLALQQCTMCHGAQGVSTADAPNLAGQYREVLIKQLTDYRSGDRPSSSVMQGLAAALSDRDIDDLAAYYADLPKPRTREPPHAGAIPALVRVGDPLRNIAPCASCHGGIDQKPGTPWLEGMPKRYVADQLAAFASGARRNDSHAQMRNMARHLTKPEIESLATYYAERAEPGSH